VGSGRVDTLACVTITIDQLEVGDDASAWTAAGFAVDDDICHLGSVAVRFTGADGPRGVRRWTLSGASAPAVEAFVAAEGVPTEISAGTDPGQAGAHPLGVTQIDHLVVMTPHIARAGQGEHPVEGDLGPLLGLGVDLIWLTTLPATSDSSAHTRWGRSMRFIVEQ
jgi:hypothetical protein